MTRWLLVAFVVIVAATGYGAEETLQIRLPNNPAVSPDGKWIAFDWNGDIWLVAASGGHVKQLTTHPARDREPKFSPDGQELAFISDRTGSPQVFKMSLAGGPPSQLTWHTAGFSLHDWMPDGKTLLVSGQRDHFWRGAERFLLVNVQQRQPEQLVFDDYGQNGAISPDGTRLLFTREGHQWWRKGYHGSQASQIWLYDLTTRQFNCLLHRDTDCRWPLWKPDASGFYFVAGFKDKTANLFEYDFATQRLTQRTQFKEDAVAFPAISRDGSIIVFRHLFDLYVLRTASPWEPTKLTLTLPGDRPFEKTVKRTLTTATQVTFSSDGLEVAFIAGGDLYVMDTELKEPVAITRTAEEERDPVFSPDNESIWFVSDQGGSCQIWKAERADPGKHWMQNKSFKLTQITKDDAVKSGLKFNLEGNSLAFVRGRGDLCVMDPKTGEEKTLFPGWSRPDFDWSPDGKWLVYAVEDQDFNSDIWIRPVDDSRPPFNISRNPFNERGPVWSPDGKVIAWTGSRDGRTTDVFFVYLQEEDHDKDVRQRSLERALEKLNRARRPTPTAPTSPTPSPSAPSPSTPAPTTPQPSSVQASVPAPNTPSPTPPGPKPKATAPVKTQPVPIQPDPEQHLKADQQPPRRPRGTGTSSTPSPTTPETPASSGEPAPPPGPNRRFKPPEVVIHFDKLHERVRKLGLPSDASPSSLVWSPDGKRLAMQINQGGTRGLYFVEFPDDLRPKVINGTTSGSGVVWLRQTNTLVLLAGGVPSTQALPALPGGTGTLTNHRFTALQEFETAARHQAVFDLAWRTMRDHYYDDRLGNNDWNQIRAKYRDVARQCPDAESVFTIVQLMLGELNGSHLGFFPGTSLAARGAPEPDAPGRWREQTAHLGVRFDLSYPGPGLKVRDVLPSGPASQRQSRIYPEEIILEIDGVAVNRDADLSQVLNGPLPRDMVLRVKNTDGKEREVTLRPITFAAARSLLYQMWVEDNRRFVEEKSGGSLGYLHISAMSEPTFLKFMEELFAVGAGKDGLVIDVRENGGGSTADHLLTALTQPVHAITVPRGGSPGYPQDRKVYATWNKPIIVLCNQNSFSNAEIFSHAIKTLGRGKLVGVPTAGGVISTGGTAIMDFGFLRLPFRGWYLIGTGEDLELNGAVPDIVIWPKPGDLPSGKDEQLAKAVEVLLADVKVWKARPELKLRKASERAVNP